MKVIETLKLTKFYGKNRGIENVSFSVEEGDYFGFIGKNGAGKSTTIRILLGLIFKSSGEAKVFGKDISNPMDYMSKIGYVNSETSFYGNMKVMDLINYSASLRGKNCEKRAREIGNRLDLDFNKKISELSLGNKKKVAIVCAMQHRPELYILDEPTSGLDPHIKRQFFELLSEENKNGSTIMLSTHILSEIQENCNKAGILKAGNLIAFDTLDNLKRTNSKKIHFKGLTEIPEIEGLNLIEKSKYETNFIYCGDIKTLISSLSKFEFSDLTITEPDLDEIFHNYYE